MGLTVGVKMNYLNDDRLDALSAAFVTGSLQGRARLRFQRLIEDSEKARERVSYWQRLLRPVTEQLQQADEIADGVNAERNWGWLAGFVSKWWANPCWVRAGPETHSLPLICPL